MSSLHFRRPGLDASAFSEFEFVIDIRRQSVTFHHEGRKGEDTMRNFLESFHTLDEVEHVVTAREDNSVTRLTFTRKETGFAPPGVSGTDLPGY